MTHSRAAKIFVVYAIAVAFSILLVVPTANAREPAVQIYGGYSLLHPNLPKFDSDPSVSKTVETLLGNLSGWNGGFTVGLTRNLGITADFTGHYENIDATLHGSISLCLKIV